MGAVFFYFQESPCFPAIRGYIGRDYAAGNAAGVYAASASFEMGHSRLDGDASAQRTGLVALLRIHRQYSLCIVHPQVQQDSFIRSRMLWRDVFTVHLCLTAPAGDIVGGWALNWEQQYVGLGPVDVSFLWRITAVPSGLDCSY